MGLHECMSSLASSGMGHAKSSEQLEEDRCWVEGARTWLVVRYLKFVTKG